MKNYIIILLAASVLGSYSGSAQTYQKTTTGPCTSVGLVHHAKKHHVKRVATTATVHPKKAVVHRHHAVKKAAPIMRTLETITVDDHSSTAIVSIKNGDVYINDSLVTSIKNPQCEDHRLIINYIVPTQVVEVEAVKTNTYTGEKAEGMLGVWGSSSCDCGEGVVVDEVMPGGPACKAGITRGDVITKINDKPINDGEDLRAALKTLSAGDNVAVTVRDYDGTETRNVELARKEIPSNCGGCGR